MSLRLLLLVSFLPWASVLEAQTIRGLVRGGDSAVRLPRAEVVVRTILGEMVARDTTDMKGDFIIELHRPGDYVLSVRYQGYAPARDSLRLKTNQIVDLMVQLNTSAAALALFAATPLEPVIVTGVIASSELHREFLERRATRHIGFFADWEEIQELLRQDEWLEPRVSAVAIKLTQGLSRCIWRHVFLDGRPSTTFGIDYPLDWVYAIEVYRSYLDLPLKYRDLEGNRSCGGILIWSSKVWGF